MFNFVLFGAPGCGKGMQSKQLMGRYQITHIAPGNAFREEIAKQTPLGSSLQGYLDQGDLVPEHIVIDSVQKQLKNLRHKQVLGFMFDGYPRSLAQAKALDKQLHAIHSQLHLVLLLEVDEETILQRLALRSILEHRADDAEEKVRHRLKLYSKYSKSIISYYSNQEVLVKVSGIGQPDVITDRIVEIIANYQPSI